MLLGGLAGLRPICWSGPGPGRWRLPDRGDGVISSACAGGVLPLLLDLLLRYAFGGV
jgi:hypothetical protein